jgi:hypothetical protein
MQRSEDQEAEERSEWVTSAFTLRVPAARVGHVLQATYQAISVVDHE